jgi:transposase-like protein
MSVATHKIFTGNFKAKIALEAIRGIKTMNVVARSLECIRHRPGYGRRNYKPRHPACLMPSTDRNLSTRLLVRNSCILRLAD